MSRRNTVRQNRGRVSKPNTAFAAPPPPPPPVIDNWVNESAVIWTNESAANWTSS